MYTKRGTTHELAFVDRAEDRIKKAKNVVFGSAPFATGHDRTRRAGSSRHTNRKERTREKQKSASVAKLSPSIAEEGTISNGRFIKFLALLNGLTATLRALYQFTRQTLGHWLHCRA